MEREAVSKLVDLGVRAELLADFPTLPADASGLLVYGSQARGDAVSGSDVDLLALVDAPRPSAHVSSISVSYYTLEQLHSGIGTLFGAHLKRDAKVVIDSRDRLTDAIDAMGEVDTVRLKQRVLRMSQLFTSPEHDLPKYLPGLLREARYLLRSCLYADAIAVGRPCFSIRELAIRHDDPDLGHLLASRHRDEPSRATLNECLERLTAIIGEFPPSENGSLEATVVNEWDTPGDLLSMAFLALGVTGRGSDYAEVEKILL